LDGAAAATAGIVVVVVDDDDDAESENDGPVYDDRNNDVSHNVRKIVIANDRIYGIAFVRIISD
jgi:hypothetical protein